MGKRPQFSNKLYEKYDKLARIAFTKWIKAKESFVQGTVEVIDHPYGQYGVDLALQWSDGAKILIDVEVRPRWRAGRFPFDTIHLPERKKKFTKYNYPVFFIAFRQDYDAFVIIGGDDLGELVHVPNRFVGDGEYFFDVDLNNCTQVFIGDSVNG
jgi:hypothetical protein